MLLDRSELTSHVALKSLRPDRLCCDLGSNSFRMSAAKIEKGELHLCQELRLPVGLMTGFRDNLLSDASLRRAQTALKQFQTWREPWSELPFRCVATSAVRQAANRHLIVDMVAKHLKVELEVLSGDEEARLIYQALPPALTTNNSKPHLIIDVGGGSTELIWGYQGEILRTVSLEMGSLSLLNQNQCHHTGKIDFRILNHQVRVYLAKYCGEVLKHSPLIAMVTDGLPKHFLNLSTTSGRLTNPAKLSFVTIMELQAQFQSKTLREWQNLRLKPDIAEIMPGGLAIFGELMRHFELKELITTPYSLKHALLQPIQELSFS